MKIAIFNRYWVVCGGGERYVGAMAEALAGDHGVDLLSPTPVDRARLEERLRLDLSATRVRPIPADPGSFTDITAEYDLLITCSYQSREFNGARHGVYVVLFPERLGGVRPMLTDAARLAGAQLERRDRLITWGEGFHPAERSGWRTFRWTSGEAAIHVGLGQGERVRARLTFLNYRPPGSSSAEASVEADGRTVGRVIVGTDGGSVPLDIDLVGRGLQRPVTLLIKSDTLGPGNGASPDPRQLGVAVRSLQLGSGLRALARARFPFLSPSRRQSTFLDSYHDIVSISEFTRHWVERWWKRDSRIIYPPVESIDPGPKDPVILSVGRFFDRSWGHSKKQLELVQAFRRLMTQGLRGWELHLVGTCEPRHADYLARVRAAAHGLPVHLHIDVPRDELVGLYRRASIFWHATGLGEREHRHPERFEHFGISTVEAMGAGAVPIVIGKAGQAEIVEDEVHGRYFATLDQLIARTRELTSDARLRARMAEAGHRRAGDFSIERFTARVRQLIAAPPASP